MPRRKKTISLDFNQFELNFLIRSVEHLAEAYGINPSPAMKATHTKLWDLRDKLSEASSKLHV